MAQPQDDVCTLNFNFFLYRNPNGHSNTGSFSHEYTNAAEMLADSARFIKALREYIPARLRIANDTAATDDYYVGPLLYESRATNQIYNLASSSRHIFRAWRPYTDSDRDIFAKFNHKVIDEKLTIRQDPTISTWNGKPLLGYYTADANGQAPQPVTLVERGIFRGQLCGATPSLITTTPTGNLRFNNPNTWNGQLGASTAPGVLRIESRKAKPLKKLRKQLLREAAREGYDHAYIFRNGLLYRVNIKTKKLTPLPTPSINLTLHNLRHITALSTEQESRILKEDGGARFTVLGPRAMLLSDIEIPAATPPQKASPTLTFPLNRK